MSSLHKVFQTKNTDKILMLIIKSDFLKIDIDDLVAKI